MRRYIFVEKVCGSYNASSKARDDVSLFVKKYRTDDGNLYIEVGNNDKSKVRGTFGKIILGVCSLVDVLNTLNKDDILFVQSSFKILKYIDLIKKFKKFRVIYFIHDLDTLRDSYDNSLLNAKTIDELNNQDVVICHNKSMLGELRRRGCKTTLIPLKIFDYYLKNVEPQKVRMKTENTGMVADVCFAGNLSQTKCGFLYLLDNCILPYRIGVYGKLETQFKHLEYMGCFTPEVLPTQLSGRFGLVWEGNSLTYNLKDHPYIMFNNPHKVSLYIVSGLPIILISENF